jgi:prepilin-type N-terminal cleavage/methylation domain-containing protein/prepilin-type processing-associated H-X9-DG protein
MEHGIMRYAGRRQARSAPPHLAGPSVNSLRQATEPQHSPIINHQSSIINANGFTLIELLVVISIIALLLSILLPCVQRVHQQAMSVACQGRLRQWGMLFQTEATAKSNGVITKELYYVFYETGAGDPNHGDRNALMNRNMIPPHLYLCPAASRRGKIQPWAFELPFGDGTTFSAGWWTRPDGRVFSQSYDINPAIMYDIPSFEGLPGKSWGELLASGSKAFPLSSIPMVFDEGAGIGPGFHQLPPPPYEEAPYSASSRWSGLCINRHGGGVNNLFLDWSVRKVGLKELWTLKWHRYFNTRGPWTKAGGVKPEDWPAWMRRFKDY